MHLRLLTLAMLLLVPIVTPGSTDPTLSANPNPIVVPSGETKGKPTLTWATEGPLCDLSVSVVCVCSEFFNHRDTEDTKVAQRRARPELFVQSPLDKERLPPSLDLRVTNPPAPIPPPDKNVYPAYIYAITSDGTLKWFRHDGAEEGKSDWQGPRDVGTGWNP